MTNKTQKPKKFDRELPVVLTTEEKAQKGLELAKHIKKRIDLVEEKRQFHAEMREKVLKLDEKIADSQNVVRTGKEQRKVKCALKMDYKENVETRAMKPDERQDELAFDEKLQDAAANESAA